MTYYKTCAPLVGPQSGLTWGEPCSEMNKLAYIEDPSIKTLSTKQGSELAFPPCPSTHWMGKAFMDALRDILPSYETRSGARLDRPTRWCGYFLNRWWP